MIGDRVGHNLPPLSEGYVSRPVLEAELTRLLTDRQHRIVTLHGIGGVGKTTVALRAAWSLALAPSSPFELIVWFSARDVDLLPEGPKVRSRAITGLVTAAEFFCELLGSGDKGEAALAVFAELLSDSTSGILVIVDNFETLDEPTGFHEWLDNIVVLPSKVLLTSRHRAFKGDFPVGVRGMELFEARDLMLRLARTLGKEPKLTDAVLTDIYGRTQGVPYAMKLVVAQLSDRVPLGHILNQSLRDEVLLDALFLRSYQALSPAAQRLFLVVANTSAPFIPTLALRAVLWDAKSDIVASIDECERLSLLEVVDAGELNEGVFVPSTARRFGTEVLAVSAVHIRVAEDLDRLRPVLAGGLLHAGLDLVGRLDWTFSTAETDDEREAAMRMLEAIAAQVPQAWKSVARAGATMGRSPEDVVAAFERAALADSHDSELWLAWSEFEAGRGNIDREIALLIRAAENDPENIGLNSNAANRIANLFARERGRFPVETRAYWTRVVKQNLEEQFDRLEASPLARLGWLYLNENDRTNARRCAERGLKLEPTHLHCNNLLRRLSDR